MARSFKDQNKVSWNEGKYKRTLNSDSKTIFKSLDRIQKDTVVLEYTRGNIIDLTQENIQEIIDVITYEDLGYNPSTKKKEFKETKSSLGGYMARRGLTNLTNETQQLLIDGNYKSSLDSFQSGWAKISGNVYQNTMINTGIGQLDTNLAQIKLMDNMLKDNKILKEQNDEIIELLKTIASK